MQFAFFHNAFFIRLSIPIKYAFCNFLTINTAEHEIFFFSVEKYPTTTGQLLILMHFWTDLGLKFLDQSLKKKMDAWLKSYF